ncbi:sugar ABC transporter permease [Anaerocolumna aminovalerica]|jgi:putative multiple sugar transport system permease protein|uniref:Xylose transport system permease protein XylH n=1 Tax=Anaerocolumna aminovalerica TaxID=1527 RepID=A0A1I5CUN9_9FIRM|nr:multiple monosaccharide ABC transporter permease [Anaerocolumna aminovalerica]SFN90674.1 multiple monosaccharide ABC transporter membrane protein [Anaerocolumna aminovalerica]
MEKKQKINIDMKQYGMIVALIVIFIIFNILSSGKNATSMNINNLIMQNSYVIILAVGMLLCVLTGNVDLGVGSSVALTGAICAIFVIDYKMPVALAFLIVLFIGLFIGMFEGFFIAALGIPPFIVTLATMLMGRGLTYIALKAQTKGPLPVNYTKIGAGYLPTINLGTKDAPLDLLCILIAIVTTIFIILREIKSIQTNKKFNFNTLPLWQVILKFAVIISIVWFFFLKLATYRGIPIVLVLMTVLVGIYHFITSKTVAGRQIYALGGNAKAARLSGINIKKVYFLIYTNMGLLCAVAGIVLSARNASATPKAGDGFEMDAIASCYIGGAATTGGIGTIVGAVVGAFIMGILNNGMSLIGWSTDIQKVVKGLVLLGAVTIDLLSKRKNN